MYPTAANVDHIPAIAAYDQRVRIVGNIEDFSQVECERIVTSACDVDRFNIDDSIVSNCGQVQRQAAAIQLQCIVAIATDDALKTNIAYGEQIITLTANQHIPATVAQQRVIASASHHDVDTSGSSQLFCRR